MSVGLYRYSGDINDKNTELIFSENISSEVFYQRYWVKAICESKVKLFKDGCDFDVGDLNIIMSELNALGAWATENLSGIDLKYMSERIISLPMHLRLTKRDIDYICNMIERYLGD